MSTTRESFLARAFWGAVLLALVVMIVLVAVPAIACFVALALVFWAMARLRRAFGMAREPNGPLDGRRNVRVITPEDRSGSPPPGPDAP
jgi:hypothetical protein